MTVPKVPYEISSTSIIQVPSFRIYCHCFRTFFSMKYIARISFLVLQVLKLHSHPPKNIFNNSPSELMENAFYFILKDEIKMFSRCLNFCLGFWVMQKKWLDQKAKVNFDIYYITTWLTITRHIAQYLTNYRQSDNEIQFNYILNIFLQKSCRK